MTLHLEISPELEAEIRKAAAREGVPPESYARSALEERVRHQGAVGSRVTESRLLEEINEGLPLQTWQRYHALCAARDADRLSEADYAELLSLTETVELWNARRLELLLQLARLRGVPLQMLVKQMGFASEPYA